MKPVIALFILLWPFADKRKPGNPLDNLPKNIRVLTRFGERADFSPDNRSIAFMSKSFGDAMVMISKPVIYGALPAISLQPHFFG